MGKNEAILHPANGVVINFKYDGLDYKITHNEKNDKDGKPLSKFFKITGDIPKIIKYLDQMQLDKVMNDHQSVNYKYYRYDNTTKKFLSNDINVNKSFDNIFLDDDIKTKIIHNIEYFLNNKPKYDELGTQRKLGYLFYGKPGNGKTSMAIAMAKTYNKNIYKIDLSVNKDSFLNQITCIPQGSIVLFEDIDTFDITHDRAIKKESVEDSDNSKKDRSTDLTLGDVLEILDGYYYLSECIVIMTTNHIEKLDSALIRPGRIDHKIELRNVSKEQIGQIIKYFYKRKIDLSTVSDLDISISELINTIIMSHMDDYAYVRDYLCENKNT